jgi:insulysin
VIVSLKSPIIYASAENVVKARIYTELLSDTLEEYAYDARLAGLQCTVSLGSRGILLKISGYNDKLRVLLQQAASTMRHLDIKEERFEVIKERATRGYSNWQLNSAYQQVGNYLSCLISEREYLMEELAAELLNVTCDSIRLFQKQVLSQMYMETFAHGNLHKEDALKITNVLESTLNPRTLPRSQLPIVRSMLLPPGANYIYNKTLQDPANANHCVETWLYIGDRADYDLRAKTLLIDQIAHEPAFNQLRTKEQLGYIVFTGIRNFATTCGIRILIQSVQTPEYLDTRIEAFLVQLGDLIDKMSDTDFEGHKHSLIINRLEKPKNLEEEFRRHWNQISGGYYDFESRM